MIGYVYFVQGVSTQLVKIGYTFMNPQKRLQIMQAESPDILRLVGVIRTAEPRVIERKIHVWLKEYNHHGEWFDGSVLILLEPYMVEYLHV